MHKHAPIVLLAEDDADLRQLIARRLVRDGMEVMEVEDGVELHDYLAQCHPGGTPDPDVVVSDVDMPRESGPHALERAHVRSPVILITAAPSPTLRAAAARAGVLHIFEKPFVLQELVTRIRQIVAPVVEAGSLQLSPARA
jgi:DNA-binding response OmpR family regulator